MNILLGSHHFLPGTGGIEMVSSILAQEFATLGHQVRVITQTKEKQDDFPLEVIRQPTASQLWQHVRWCDVFFQNNISLRTLWPLLLIRRKLVVTHQTWLTVDGRTLWQSRAKRFVLRFAKSIAISRAIASTLPVQSVVLGNPYDDAVFKKSSALRSKELIFVGRLVSDKGVDVLIQTLHILRSSALTPQLTIIGDGPEREPLEKQVAALGLQKSVEFLGRQDNHAIAAHLNQHRILVVPSRWAEPFGIVALEGIACGCVVIGSEQGGLPEAIGPCGMTFPNADASALAAALAKLLSDPHKCELLLSSAEAHLARFKPRYIAEQYLAIMTSER